MKYPYALESNASGDWVVMFTGDKIACEVMLDQWVAIFSNNRDNHRIIKRK